MVTGGGGLEARDRSMCCEHTHVEAILVFFEDAQRLGPDRAGAPQDRDTAFGHGEDHAVPGVLIATTLPPTSETRLPRRPLGLMMAPERGVATLLEIVDRRRWPSTGVHPS